jgi:hypothetical protein
MGFKPITENREAKRMSCHVVLNKDREIVAIIHGFITRTGYRVDVYERGILSYQNRVVSEDPIVALGATKDVKGAEIDGIKLYRRGVRVQRGDATVMRPLEDKYYLPGFDRLKVRGYEIIKVL